MKKQLRILHVIESLGVGGAEKRLLADVGHLSREDHFSNHVCTLYSEDAFTSQLRDKGIPVTSLGMKNLYHVQKGLWGLQRLLHTFQPDIVHTQLFGADLYGRVAGRFFGGRVVSTFQSSVHEPTTPYLFSRKRRFLDKQTSRLAHRFIAVSEYVKRSVVQQLHLDPERVEVIHNYVDFELFTRIDSDRVAALRQEFGLDQSKKIVMSVVKFHPAKGQHYLIQAFKELSMEFPNTRLLLVGEGSEEATLRKLCTQLRLDGTVHFLGTRLELAELLSLADIFVLPTLSEGFPLTVLEAMALQRPCIVTRLGPILEMLEDGVTGLLTEPANPRQIVEATRFLLKHPEEAKNIGVRAYENARAKFDAPLAIQKLKHFYEKVFEENRDDRKGRFVTLPSPEREQCWLFPKDLPKDLNKHIIGHERSSTSLKARYLFAGCFLKTGTVLDCACGTGAGTEILRRCASRICSAKDLFFINLVEFINTGKWFIKSLLLFKKVWSRPGIFRRPRIGFKKPVLVGVDISKKAIRFANHHYPENRFQVADIYRLPFQSEGFDAVVSFETMEHLDNIDVAISETKRVLKKGGLFLGSIPVRHKKNPFHKEEYSAEKVVELFSKVYSNPIFFGMRQNGFIYWGGSQDGLLSDPNIDYVLIMGRKN